ncbi:hypothetical protein ANCCAN_06021 [Ancylostoma caninum]|uniref:Uncharacterized protein n=1 Tax=Ancylostoma caninum TaxID=29170 RepID=A0A368GXA3_ANCCA|nr:hypothetical protein ANCCAN_06021 [Ancylostoma caninum]
MHVYLKPELDKIKQGLKNTQKTGSKSNENVHTAEKLSNEKKVPPEKPTQKRGSKGKRVTKENIKDKPTAQENIKDKPVPHQDKKEKPGSKENNKDEPVPKASGLKENKDEPLPKAKIEAKPASEEKIGGKPVPDKKEDNKKNAKDDKQIECKTPEQKSIEEFKTADEGESPKKKKSPPSSREPSLKEPERKHSEYLIYRAEIIGKDKQKTEVKDKPKMMGKSKATRSPNPKGIVDSVECG